MKKWFRGLWIGLLSGTAFLASCGLKPQSTLYGPPPEDSTQVQSLTRRQFIQQQIDSIRAIIEKREFAEVYGSPEIIEAYSRETNRLKEEAAKLEAELKELDNE